MRARRTLTAIAVLMLAVTPAAACQSAPSPDAGAPPSVEPPRPLPSDDTPVRVALERTGGMAGQTTTVVVDTEGRWSYTVAGAEPQRGRLTEAQASALWRLANNPDLSAEAKRAGSPAACPERYAYTLKIGEDRQLRGVDCGKLPPTLNSVFVLLRDATPL
ncbi:MAG: hypothetical protein ACRDT4_06895 [Micromonosporaceae bacterium]